MSTAVFGRALKKLSSLSFSYAQFRPILKETITWRLLVNMSTTASTSIEGSNEISLPPPTKRIRTSEPPKKKLVKSKRKAKHANQIDDSDPMYYSIRELLGDRLSDLVEQGKDVEAPFTHFQEVAVSIVALSSHGDGLGFAESNRDWVVIVPFTVPGEKVLAKIYRSDWFCSYADNVKILEPEQSTSSPLRNDALIKCRYFGQCGGCQFQHLPYQFQLEHKRKVVMNAFKNFSKLSPDQIPEVLPTIPSPNQYAYRTKLTPHFEAPSTKLTLKDRASKLAIGFETKGRRKILDIEECVIATSCINAELTEARSQVRENVGQYKRGATLLLRHSLLPASSTDGISSTNEPVCITKHNEIVRETVCGRSFEFNAGSFFQNNNGILEALVSYVTEQIDVMISASSESQYLVDAYCGSGLFAVTLASKFDEVSGVEISSDSVKWAKHNAKLNNVNNAKFIAGKAEAIFESILYPSKQTTVLIDPPRKGCDNAFLGQLIKFGPAQVLYVSCNVHTQARDVKYLVNEGGYRIQSIRGADLFPRQSTPL